MLKIVPIVEGQGEVEAVPVLLRKLLVAIGRYDIQIASPKNVHGRSNLLKINGLERFLEIAYRESDCGAVLVLIDADTDCPIKLAAEVCQRIKLAGVRFPVVTVVAKCEYEAWFLASIEKVSGNNGLPEGLIYTEDVEQKRNVKGWLSEQMPKGSIYKETTDQAPLTHHIDFDLARQRSRSFRRLCHAIEEAVAAIDSGQIVVTPFR